METYFSKIGFDQNIEIYKCNLFIKNFYDH